MFKINKDVEYALIALRAMSGEDRVYSARELSDSYEIPAGILAKIMQRLSHGEMVKSIKGPKGGYRLTRNADQITLGSVIDAVHGPERIVPCIEDPGTCGQEDTCTIKHGFETMQGVWLGFLNSLTLNQFDEMSRGGIPSASSM